MTTPVADISLAVPITNSLTFLFTTIVGAMLGESIGGVRTFPKGGMVLLYSPPLPSPHVVQKLLRESRSSLAVSTYASRPRIRPCFECTCRSVPFVVQVAGVVSEYPAKP